MDKSPGQHLRMLLLWLYATLLPGLVQVHAEDTVGEMKCDLAVVGAGVGGAYAAWRASSAGKSVCVFELNGRPGGRIHSLRKMGPKHDLVVEAGAYRFTSKKICYHEITNWCVDTPITRATVKELDLPIAKYDVDQKQWDHDMRKIVDADGHDAGYLTLPETLLARATAKGAKVVYKTKALYLTKVSKDDKDDAPALRLHLSGNLSSVLAGAVLFNTPQGPLLEILRNSGSPFTEMFSAPLHRPRMWNMMKLYVHYQDAWWINDLGLKTGHFENENPGLEEKPAPLSGQYHDGDIRCDLQGGRCRGFIQAYYAEKGVEYYKPFHPVYGDAAVELSHEVAEQHELLTRIHEALVELHRKALDAVNATERVKHMSPDSGVLSMWTGTVEGINTGCHRHNLTIDPNFTQKALQPFPGFPIFVANEAFGPNSCWAEGSLNMSHSAMEQMGVPVPDLRALWEHLPYPGPPTGDPSLLRPWARSRSSPQPEQQGALFV